MEQVITLKESVPRNEVEVEQRGLEFWFELGF